MALNICDNVIVMCEFNIYVNKDVGNDHFKLDVSCDTLNLTNLIKSYTCYSNNHKLATDIFLTNKPRSFIKSQILVLKPKITCYCNFRRFEK